MFADNTTLIILGETQEENKQQSEDHHARYRGKTKFIKTQHQPYNTYQLDFITNNSHQPQQITNNKFETTSQTKFLGLQLDSHLTWNIHTDLLGEKIILSNLHNKKNKNKSRKETNSSSLPFPYGIAHTLRDNSMG